MRAQLIAFTVLALASTPALAGGPVPGPEVGVGLAAMLMVGAGYVYLRRRAKR